MWHSLGNTAAVPPSSAVVVETVNAAWGGPNSSGGSDIPNGTTPTSQPPNYTATRYSVQNGSNFILTCTPFANFSATNPPGQSLMGGSAFVGYTATAYPVYITLKGATLDGGVYKVLAGQQVVATLNTGVAVNSITYQWAVTGGTGAFETYDSSAPNQQHATQLVPLSGADKQAVNFSFYDRKVETVTVTCTANFQFPDGTTGTATATSPQITVLKPTAAWKITPGYVQKFTLPDVPGYDLYGLDGVPNTQYLDGEDWHDVAISVTSPFSGGQGCFAQLWTPDREFVSGGVAQPLPGVSNNKVEGLDNAFPYQSYTWNVPAQGNRGDNPSIGVKQGSTNGGVIDAFTAQDSFRTWLMYMPPSNGYGTVWVPLQMYTWNWSATVSWLNNQWQLTASYPTVSNEPSYTITNTDDPPTWGVIQTNTNH